MSGAALSLPVSRLGGAKEKIMRIFEILILVTLLPTLVGFFFPTNRRPRWLAFLPGVALLFIIFHLIVEGYRSQMIPAYALTAILLLPTIRTIIRRAPQSEPASEAPSRRRKAVAVLGVLFFVTLMPITVKYLYGYEYEYLCLWAQ